MLYRCHDDIYQFQRVEVFFNNKIVGDNPNYAILQQVYDINTLVTLPSKAETTELNGSEVNDCGKFKFTPCVEKGDIEVSASEKQTDGQLRLDFFEKSGTFDFFIYRIGSCHHAIEFKKDENPLRGGNSVGTMQVSILEISLENTLGNLIKGVMRAEECFVTSGVEIFKLKKETMEFIKKECTEKGWTLSGKSSFSAELLHNTAVGQI